MEAAHKSLSLQVKGNERLDQVMAVKVERKGAMAPWDN